MSSQGKIELYQLRQHQGIGTISVELDDAGLRIANGKTISWGSSHNVNLNRVDTTEYQIAHFLCRIETDEGSFKFLANIDEPLELKQYHAFVYDLHQRLAKFKSNAVFTTGMNSQTAFRAMVLGGITIDRKSVV